MTYGDHTKEGARPPNKAYDKIESIDWSNAPHKQGVNQMNTTTTEFQIIELNFEIKEQRVRHILHLLLSIITVGFWLLPWFIVTLMSTIEIRRLKHKIKKLKRKATFDD